MFYEAISHRTITVESAAAAAARIRTRNVSSFDALVWKSKDGQRIAAVADGGLDSPWGEVAVINLDANRQLDSITFAWIKDDAEAIAALADAESLPPLSSRHANLPLDGAGEDTPAEFTCGCCGDLFVSTIAAQRIHDQDEGYGHCPDCA